MQKALTKEDLMYILSGIFKLSSQQNNAFSMEEDGLYVPNLRPELENHTTNESIHIEQRLRNIFDRFTLDENGNLYYDLKPVNTSISSQEKNAIQTLLDGLYVEDIVEDTKEHIDNIDIHVTTEDKDSWNQTLDTAKEFTVSEIEKLVFHDFQIVTSLPEQNISDRTIYMLVNDPDATEETPLTLNLHLADQWIKLAVTQQTLQKFALKTQLEDYLLKDDSHTHDNKDYLDKFTETTNGDLLYNNKNVSTLGISEDPNNAAQLRDGKLWVKDFTNEYNSLAASSAFAKTVLYQEECAECGKYVMADYMYNYNILIIDFYYKPNDESESPGNAKSVIVDTDTMEDLYTRGIDYLLELGYGISVANSKIRMHNDTLWVNYYHNVCIYKITGIKRGDAS